MTDLSELLGPLVDGVGPGPSVDELAAKGRRRRRRRWGTGLVGLVAAAAIAAPLELSSPGNPPRTVGVGSGPPGTTTITNGLPVSPATGLTLVGTTVRYWGPITAPYSTDDGLDLAVPASGDTPRVPWQQAVPCIFTGARSCTGQTVPEDVYLAVATDTASGQMGPGSSIVPVMDHTLVYVVSARSECPLSAGPTPVPRSSCLHLDLVNADTGKGLFAADSPSYLALPRPRISATSVPPAAAGKAVIGLSLDQTTAPARGEFLDATVTVNNDTGKPIALPSGPCVGWIQVGLANRSAPFDANWITPACQASYLPTGVSTYPVQIATTYQSCGGPSPKCVGPQHNQIPDLPAGTYSTAIQTTVTNELILPTPTQVTLTPAT